MSFLILWASALPFLLAMALVAWAVATWRRNAGLVDIFWPLFFVAAGTAYAHASQPIAARGSVAGLLVAAWALRLAWHLAARNWNAPEDRRYREIRSRNEPGFAWKSLYLVFGLQAVLAWIIAAPLAAIFSSAEPIGALDIAGIVLAATGIAFEAIADAQLARFKADASSEGRVMDRGLWRYSRHPNYFGEALTWWGFGLLAAGTGAWMTLCSPLLMTWLLLRVTGVKLLERDIGARRPDYLEYARRTSPFLPWPPRSA